MSERQNSRPGGQDPDREFLSKLAGGAGRKELRVLVIGDGRSQDLVGSFVVRHALVRGDLTIHVNAVYADGASLRDAPDLLSRVGDTSRYNVILLNFLHHDFTVVDENGHMRTRRYSVEDMQEFAGEFREFCETRLINKQGHGVLSIVLLPPTPDVRDFNHHGNAAQDLEDEAIYFRLTTQFEREWEPERWPLWDLRSEVPNRRALRDYFGKMQWAAMNCLNEQGKVQRTCGTLISCAPNPFRDASRDGVRFRNTFVNRLMERLLDEVLRSNRVWRRQIAECYAPGLFSPRIGPASREHPNGALVCQIPRPNRSDYKIHLTDDRRYHPVRRLDSNRSSSRAKGKRKPEDRSLSSNARATSSNSRYQAKGRVDVSQKPPAKLIKQSPSMPPPNRPISTGARPKDPNRLQKATTKTKASRSQPMEVVGAEAVPSTSAGFVPRPATKVEDTASRILTSVTTCPPPAPPAAIVSADTPPQVTTTSYPAFPPPPLPVAAPQLPSSSKEASAEPSKESTKAAAKKKLSQTARKRKKRQKEEEARAAEAARTSEAVSIPLPEDTSSSCPPPPVVLQNKVVASVDSPRCEAVALSVAVEEPMEEGTEEVVRSVETEASITLVVEADPPIEMILPEQAASDVTLQVTSIVEALDAASLHSPVGDPPEGLLSPRTEDEDELIGAVP